MPLKSFYLNNKEVLKYIIVGGLTTLVSLVTYYTCVLTVLNPRDALQLQIANVVSWITSVAFAYFTNRRYVFESKNPRIINEAFLFFISRIGTLLVDVLMMFVLVTAFGFNDKISKLFVQIVVIIGNYIISKKLVFNNKK